ADFSVDIQGRWDEIFQFWGPRRPCPRLAERAPLRISPDAAAGPRKLRMSDHPVTAAVSLQGELIAGSSVAIVPWWSFTKTVIAAAALKLHEQGQLDLDAQVDSYPFTLRQLLRHTAGVGNYGGLAEYHQAVARGDHPWSDDALFARVPPAQLLFQPGGGWA